MFVLCIPRPLCIYPCIYFVQVLAVAIYICAFGSNSCVLRCLCNLTVSAPLGLVYTSHSQGFCHSPVFHTFLFGLVNLLSLFMKLVTPRDPQPQKTETGKGRLRMETRSAAPVLCHCMEVVA